MQTLSAVFHPLLMATYSTALLFLLAPALFGGIPRSSMTGFIGIIFFSTCLIPAISILFLKFTRQISNMDISHRQERLLPFFSIVLFYMATTYMLYQQMNVPLLFLYMMLMVTVLMLIVTLISFRFKISVHATAIWGVSGLFSALSFKYLTIDQAPWIGLIYISAGATTTSRLYLKKHTPAESWSGAFLGYIFCFTAFFLFS